MADARLTGSDKRTLILWILLGIVGAFFAHRYFFQAFPEASVDFKVSRNESQKRAKAFVESLGENLSSYQSTITFEVDEDAKTYLERELGLKQANQLMSGALNIWYWDVRFFRPQQEEEFHVRVSPAGSIVGYYHKVEEGRAAKSLDREQALAVSQQFLQSKLGTDLSHWTFLPEEVNSTVRPNRVDWSFTWERTGFKAKDAPYRLVSGVLGDRAGNAHEYLQVPEAWTRSYEHLRSTNNFYGELALAPYGLLLGGALWVGISLWRQGRTSWGPALKVGAFAAGLFFLMELNDWNSVRAGYDTRSNYTGFILLSFLWLLLMAVANAMTISLVMPGGEPLYREAQPDRLRLTRAFTLRGIRSKEFFCASVIGLSLAAAHLGFIVAFYIVGNHFGVWAPQDINYSDIVNTPFPWIAGMAIGVFAAANEEITFRLFAIPFLRKLTGSRVLAVILPAFFWSFLHSNYPQEPGYIRGIEVGIIGIVAGLVMLRWGIVATLIWHYTVDASLVGLLLIRSDNLYFKISGIVVGLAAFAPLLFSGVLYLLRGSFEEVEDLLNQAQPVEINLAKQSMAGPTEISARRYDALTTSMIGFLTLCLLIGGIAAWRFKTEEIGDYLKLSVDRISVTQNANVVIHQHGLDPNSFWKAALLVDTTSPITNEFLRRRMSIAQINDIYAHRVPGVLWRVRYFRDSQNEEYAVTVKPDGSLQGFWHTLPEDAKGPNLSKQEAVAIAEKYLQEQKKIDLTGWKLVEANSDKRPHRTDTTLTWEQTAPLDPANAAKDSSDHAYARMELTVLGGEPADFRTYIKIPQEFVRHQTERTLPRILILIAQAAVGLGLLIAVFVLYFKHLRESPQVPWRRLFAWSCVGIAATAFSFFFGRGIPGVLAQYLTATPMRLFFGTMAVGTFLAGAFVLGVLTLTFGLAWSFGARAFGEEQLPTWFGMPANYYRDAFWIALGGSTLMMALERFLGYASNLWPTMQRALPSEFGTGFDSIYPGPALAGASLSRAFFAVAFLALAGAFIGSELRARWLRLSLFVAVAASLVVSWGSPADFLKQFLANVIMLAVVVFGVRLVVRFNLLGVFLISACTALLAGAAQLLGQPNSLYRRNGYVLLLVMAILLAWPVLSWQMRRNAPQS